MYTYKILSVYFLGTNVTQKGTRALIQGERMVKLAYPTPIRTCSLCPFIAHPLSPDLWSLSPRASPPAEKWGMKGLRRRSSLWKNP